MNARQRWAIAIVALAAIALFVLHALSNAPLAVTPAAVTTATLALATPTAPSDSGASLAPSLAPSGPEALTSSNPSPVTSGQEVATSSNTSAAPSGLDVSANSNPSPIISGQEAAPISSASAVPSPTPTPSPDPDLLSEMNGAFVRSWTVGGWQDNPQNLPEKYGSVAVTPSFNRPVALVYELPAVAHLDRVGVALRGEKPARVDVAIGTDIHQLRDIGSVSFALPADSDTAHSLDIAADARFIRFTVTKTANDSLRVASVTAAGTSGAPQRGVLDGFWINLAANSVATQLGEPGGRVPDAVPTQDASTEQRAAVEEDGRFAFFQCRYRSDPWIATLADGVARGGTGVLQLAGTGNLLVGTDGHEAVLAIRSKALPACGSSSAGKGPVVATFVRVVGEDAPEVESTTFPRLRFESHFAPLLSASQLQHAQFAVIDGDCTASIDFSPRRQQILMDWVRAGHKLIIRDADMCQSSDYAFVPFHFSTNATGARGERGNVLAIADPSTLGEARGDAAHFLDVPAYLASNSQQIGDADIMKTDDPHWCGHLFATNAVHVNGWVHAYARYGRGLIIYDGFDRDDIRSAIPAARRLVELEYAQPVQADLPCNARVASALALYPSISRALPAGKPVVVRAPMNLVSTAPSAPPEDVTLSIEGDARFAVRVSPAHVHLPGGGTHAVEASVSLPNGWSGSHAFSVKALGPYGTSAQATIFIDGSIALAKAFESQRRVRLYGIHFDVASAKIQPISEATISQIGQVLAAHPDWSLRVEGHTDSDGGAAYNLDLSLRRAGSVVDDLVRRYHVRRSRLHAAGFGLTKPVASNQTEAGKALNRRVELVRL